MEYVSKGQGIYNTVAGSIGMASGVLSGLGGLIGAHASTGEESEVTRHELAYVRELAEKDHKIAELQGNTYTDNAIKNLSDQMAVKFNQIDQRLNGQEILNTTQTNVMGCMQNQINQLMSMTQLIIPNANVMPGWGNVTITPTGSATVKGAVSSGN